MSSIISAPFFVSSCLFEFSSRHLTKFDHPQISQIHADFRVSQNLLSRAERHSFEYAKSA
jgi:hypothetical protein